MTSLQKQLFPPKHNSWVRTAVFSALPCPYTHKDLPTTPCHHTRPSRSLTFSADVWEGHDFKHLNAVFGAESVLPTIRVRSLSEDLSSGIRRD